MGITASNSSFNPAFKVYSLPLSDMSRPETNKYDMFDQYFDEFRSTFKIGDLVNAIIINNQHSSKSEEVGLLGKINKYIVDHENKRIRVFIISDMDNELHEVYPETIFSRDGLYETLMNRFEENYNVLRM
jgi:hypothetical protein